MAYKSILLILFPLSLSANPFKTPQFKLMTAALAGYAYGQAALCIKDYKAQKAPYNPFDGRKPVAKQVHDFELKGKKKE
jgi:hypothetical protein